MADELGRADFEWRAAQESFVALSVAAAMAFRHAQGAAASLSQQEHDDALNIAASALSRLVTIYAVDEATRTRVPLKLDVLKGRFMRGATEFRRSNGSVVTTMTVQRGDLAAALSMITRAGIPFGLAMDGGRTPAPDRK